MHDEREHIPAVASADNGPPDWDQVDEDVICPLCHYQLRGLIEPRCPECGYTFTWPEVLDPRKRLHPYLYEHHPERSALAYRQTMLRSWLPKRFFRLLHPVQPVNRARLIRYAWIGMLIYLLSFLPVIVLRTITVHKTLQPQLARYESSIRRDIEFNPERHQQYIDHHGSRESYIQHGLDQYRSNHYRRGLMVDPSGFGIPFLVIMILWPLTLSLLNYLALLIFQQTMRRARVNRLHVLRAVVYSYDQYALLGILLVSGTAGLWMAAKEISFAHYELILVNVNLASGAIFLFASFRLSVAYREYLRFPQPSQTVFLAQFIVALFLIVLFINVSIA